MIDQNFIKVDNSVFDRIKQKTEKLSLKCINHKPQDLHLQLIKDQLIRHREVQTIAVKSTGLVKTLALNNQLSPGLSTYEAYAVFKTRKWKFEGGWLIGQLEEGLG